MSGACKGRGVSRVWMSVALAATFVTPEVAWAGDEGEDGFGEQVEIAQALSGEEVAQQRRRRTRRARKAPAKRRRRRRRAQAITVPVNVAVGPTANFITGPVQQDQLVHTGLKLDVYAVLNQALIRQNLDRVPAEYRKQASKMTEVRYAPAVAALLPHSLEISPAIPGVTGSTGIYGATWSPFGVGLALISSPVRVSLDLSLLGKIAFLHSENLPNTLFARPGIGAGIDLEIPITDAFLISLGWNSQVYVPQRLGLTMTDFLTVGDIENSIWHWGQAYVQFHVRFPYTTVM